MAPADWKRLTELAAVKAGPAAHEHTAAPRGSHRALFGYASPQPVGGLVTPWAAWDGAVGDRLAGNAVFRRQLSRSGALRADGPIAFPRKYRLFALSTRSSRLRYRELGHRFEP